MMKKPSVTFLMPGSGNKPQGGYKVVYEYANRLASDGYDVHILYPLTLNFRKETWLYKFKTLPRFFRIITHGISGKPWFKLNDRIHEHFVLSLNQKHVNKSDIYIATAVRTSFILSEYKDIPEDKRLYLIQDYETWRASEEYVDTSYKLGLENIVVSSWLKDKVQRAGATATLLRNGFNFDYFKLNIPIESSERDSISMMYSINPRKGWSYGFEVLKRIKEHFPEIKVRIFGVSPRPSDIPQWIEYYQQPNKDIHNYIYNKSKIYIAPSLQEGWGLTVGEAMICGAAIVCTDTLGFQEMVTNNESGMIVPSRDVDKMVSAITKLLNDNNFRIKLATQGRKIIQNFTWESSYSQLKGLIEGSVIHNIDD